MSDATDFFEKVYGLNAADVDQYFPLVVLSPTENVDQAAAWSRLLLPTFASGLWAPLEWARFDGRTFLEAFRDWIQARRRGMNISRPEDRSPLRRARYDAASPPRILSSVQISADQIRASALRPGAFLTVNPGPDNRENPSSLDSIPRNEGAEILRGAGEQDAYQATLVLNQSYGTYGGIARSSSPFWRGTPVPDPESAADEGPRSFQAASLMEPFDAPEVRLSEIDEGSRPFNFPQNGVDVPDGMSYDATRYDNTQYDTTQQTMPPTAQAPPPSRNYIDPLKLKLELIYGRSGAGKTSWILKLARYLFLKTGKRTRWYIADGGAETITLTGWAGPNGFIDLYLFSTRNNPIETCQRICEGAWPVDPLDPNTKMLQPTAEVLEQTGLWVFEGLTFMSDYMMGDKQGGMAWRMAKGEMLNRDDSFRVKDGDITFGGNARTHYMFVQRRIQDLVSATAQLPGLKYWTAHELKVDDQELRESIFGPDVCGQKLTTKIPASFGNTIHMHVAHIEEKKKDPVTSKEVKVIKPEYRAYLQTHYDPDAQATAKYIANTRIDARVREAYPDLIPEYIVADPVRFYSLLELARSKEAELDQKMADLPDLPGLTSTAPAEKTRSINLS